MRRCLECGKRIKSDSARFCPYCGEPVAASKTQKKKSFSPAAYVRFVLPGTAVLVILLLSAVSPKGKQDRRETEAESPVTRLSSEYESGNSNETSRETLWAVRPTEAATEAPYDNGNTAEVAEPFPSPEEQEDMRLAAYEAGYTEEEAHIKETLSRIENQYEHEGGELGEIYRNAEEFTSALLRDMAELDPEIKEQVLPMVAEEFDDSDNAEYILQTVFADNENGKAWRELMSSATGLLVTAGESLVNSLFAISDPDNLLLLQTCGDYAWMVSKGTIEQINEEIDRSSGYTYLCKWIDMRKAELSETDELEAVRETFGFSSSMEEDGEYELYEFCYELASRRREGRSAFLDKTKNDWTVQLQTYKEKLFAPLLNQSYGSGKLYCLLDRSGKILWGYIGNGDDCVLNEQGTVALRAPYYENYALAIYDKKGTLLFESDERTRYYGPASNGNVLKMSLKDDFEHGEHYSLELITSDGNTIPLIQGWDMEWDFYLISNPTIDEYGFTYNDLENQEYHSVVIRADTGELFDVWDGSEYSDLKEKKEKQEIYRQIDAVFGDHENTVIVDGTQNRYLRNGVLFNDHGESIRDLSGGQGVNGIFYHDGVYWVMSNSKYWYTLDENGDYLLEPRKADSYLYYNFTEYGLIIGLADDEEHFERMARIYDETGTVIKTILAEKVDGRFAYLYGNQTYDLENGRIVRLSLSELQDREFQILIGSAE